jgi:hypothetical protein
MFRDRVVSMEQTLEGGEKHLELLKSLCREAFPEFEYRSHALDHERDLFVMTLGSPDGRTKNVGWTRMVLFDAERVPALSVDAAHALRERVVGFLRSRATRPEVVVTFRHLEEGWVDTPEPRRERRRRRGRGGDRRGAQPSGSPPAEKQRQPQPPQHAARAAAAGPRVPVAHPPSSGRRPEAGGRATGPGGSASAAAEGSGAEGKRPGGRRRRFRRRRRGRGGPASGTPPGTAPGGPAGGA